MNNAFIESLKKILFIDIETVSAYNSFTELPERFKSLWEKKSKYIASEAITPEQSFFDKAAIYAEFGKVIVIGLGFFHTDKNGELAFRSKSIQGHDEKTVLEEFKALLDKKYNTQTHRLCAHNGKEFDYPYLCRRMLVNKIELPKILRLSDKKPWEVQHYDTLDMWKFGDKKAYTSLELLAATLDVPTSKDGIDGSMVNETYYKKNDLEKIATYCRKDVVVTAQIYLRITSNSILSEDKISFL
jgi:uncharacterized protein YprB with RNaseH-like and TPR domain